VLHWAWPLATLASFWDDLEFFFPLLFASKRNKIRTDKAREYEEQEAASSKDNKHHFAPRCIINQIHDSIKIGYCMSNTIYSLISIKLATCFDPMGPSSGLHYEPINLLNPAGHVMRHSTSVCSAHTVFMCFVFIWEQTATCATYSINWLVFTTEMKSVYSAVRTGSLNKAVCAWSLKG